MEELADKQIRDGVLMNCPPHRNMFAYQVGTSTETGISEALHTALGMIQQWCDRADLSISPSKTVVMPFTKNRALEEIKV